MSANASVNPFRLIRSDFRRYLANESLLRAIVAEGVWAGSIYRIRHWVRCGEKVPLRPLLEAGLYLIQRIQRAITGIAINPGAHIGPGLYLLHFGGVYVSKWAVIGSNCTILQGVTIGEDRGVAPQIGDRVTILAGALMFGDITVGDDAVIGAGAVVCKDVPAGATVAGNPAREISRTPVAS